jgi:multisubunit Na+/H+ antiporter MnhE subunit
MSRTIRRFHFRSGSIFASVRVDLLPILLLPIFYPNLLPLRVRHVAVVLLLVVTKLALSPVTVARSFFLIERFKRFHFAANPAAFQAY